MQSRGEQLGPNFRALRTGIAICTRRVPAPVKKCRQNVTSAKTEKTGAENDKMQLCGLILIIEGLFNPIGPASSRARIQLLLEARNTRFRASNSKRQEGEAKRPSAKRVTVKRTTKRGSLGERVAKLKDGESIVLECDGDAVEEAQKIRNGLYNLRACMLVRRTVKVVDRKIVITRVGTRRTLRG